MIRGVDFQEISRGDSLSHITAIKVLTGEGLGLGRDMLTGTKSSVDDVFWVRDVQCACDLGYVVAQGN